MTEKQKAIFKAIEAVEKGASISAAARQYGIPRSTLGDKVSGRYAVECSKGPGTVLTKVEEEHLKNWIIFMANNGFPITKAQLLDSVSILVKKLKRENSFKNVRPGRHWFGAFIKRHPEVGQRVAQNLTQTRALVKESCLRTWFKEVEDYFSTVKLEEAAQDPRRVFNCDESAFFLSPTDNRVLAKRGSKSVYNVIPSSEKECVTVLVTANAAGELAPPMVLFKLKSIPHKISKTAPNAWGLGHTQKGWMTGESFYEYMANVFYPWIEKSDIQLPIIFFLDGHCSHTTLPLSNFCREKNIHLVALYPNATHLLQPMDVAVFRPIKRIWKKTVYDWRNDNQYMKLKKENFCPLLQKTLQQLDPNTIKSGFRKCGLSPFDANNVDYSKCMSYQNNTNTGKANNVQPDTVGHLTYLESRISPENVEAFYKSGPTWRGDKSLEGLFNVWKQMNTTNQLPLDGFNEGLTSLTAQELFANKSPSLDIGNFTGLTDILNSNSLNSYEFSDLTENDSHIGDMEMYEVINGTLMKLTDIEIPREPSLTKLAKQTQEPFHSNQVIRTIGSQPIYLTPLKKIKSIGLTSTVTLTNSVPTHITPPGPDHITPSGSNHMTLAELDHIIPPRPDYLSLLGHDHVTSDNTLDYKQNKLTTECFQVALKTQVQPENNNSEKPKKYYGHLVVPTPFKDALFWPDTPSSSTKTKLKLPSVITSDRWQIFAQNKIDSRTKKEKTKIEAKEKKSKKSEPKKQNNTQKKKKTDNIELDDTQEWFCRLCQTHTKMDMIECIKCKVWYHTQCAEVLPNEITFNCMYCNVKFD